MYVWNRKDTSSGWIIYSRGRRNGILNDRERETGATRSIFSCTIKTIQFLTIQDSIIRLGPYTMYNLSCELNWPVLHYDIGYPFQNRPFHFVYYAIKPSERRENKFKGTLSRSENAVIGFLFLIYSQFQIGDGFHNLN